MKAHARTDLVNIQGHQAFTTSLIIAENCDNRSHESTIKLIRKYQSDFEELGSIRFEIQPFETNGGIQNREICYLNEDQATYLITLFRNTPAVRKFKLKLVKEFRKAIDEINRLYSEPQRTVAIKSKRAAHFPMMDALKEIRADQGKETRDDNYMCESKLCNFIVLGRFVGVNAIGGEDELTNEQIVMLDKVRKLNESLLLLGMDYAERKKRLVEYGVKYRTKLISKNK